MDLLQQIISKAKAQPQRIVLPESYDERTLRAANELLSQGIAHIILIGAPETIAHDAQKLGLEHLAKAQIVDPHNHPHKQEYTNLLCELRKAKGMTPEKAALLVQDPLYLACLMIKAGHADGEVAGARNTTGDVLRPALQIIKTAPGISCVSGAFIMITKAPQYGQEGMLIFADCAVMPTPTASELAQIAVASAGTAKALVGMEPAVAMLSFSTKGSAQHEVVEKVAEATRLAKELAPNLQIDGELQADAALVPEVGALKSPGSAVAGKANVLVFPSLEAANIGYKLVQRLGNATAIGPVLQGIAAPVNDLSRGCSVQDIVHLVAITATQAIAAKQAK